MKLKIDAKFVEKLICCLKVNFDLITRNSQNF